MRRNKVKSEMSFFEKHARAFMTGFIVAIFALGAITTDLIFTRQQLSAEEAPELHLGAPMPENLFVQLANVINPSVVNISSTYIPKAQYEQFPMPYNDPFFQMFQQMFPQQYVQPQPVVSLGSGFIIRSDGLILTNNHVVKNATIIKVQLSEKSKKFYTAKLIGHDARADLAVIKINAGRPLPAVVFGQSSKLQVGDWVAAFGNPLGLGHTMTKGIISATGREIQNLNQFPFLQTDATINPGNSGGPLVNTLGEVVGVNTAIAADAPGGAIGFAIPIDLAKPIIAKLERGEIIHHPYLGVYLQQLNYGEAQYLGLSDAHGAFISGVMQNSPAQRAGIRNGDFIIRFDGKKITDAASLQRYIEDATPGKTYPIEVLRNRRKIILHVTLVDNPDQEQHYETPPEAEGGRLAPFGLGFSVLNYSEDLAHKFGLPKLERRGPIVVAVRPGSPANAAGLSAGDMIVDVNRHRVETEEEMVRYLRRGKINTLRVLRGGYPLMIFISK